MADLNSLYNRFLSFILIHRPTARWIILFYTMMDMFWPGWDGYPNDVHGEHDGAEREQEWDWEDDAFFSEYMIGYDPFW
ncbi:hypothetical protein BDV09DRAFT_200359 [Aspergillus tetrazonus]